MNKRFSIPAILMVLAIILTSCASNPFTRSGSAVTPQDTFSDPNTPVAVEQALRNGDDHSLTEKDLVGYQGIRVNDMASTDEVEREIKFMNRDDHRPDVAFNVTLSQAAVQDMRHELIRSGEDDDVFMYLQTMVEGGEDHFMMTSSSLVTITETGWVNYVVDDDGNITIPSDDGTGNGDIKLFTYNVRVGGYGNWHFFRPLKADFGVHRNPTMPETQFAALTRETKLNADRATATEATLTELEQVSDELKATLNTLDPDRVATALDNANSLMEIAEDRVPTEPIGEVESNLAKRTTTKLSEARSNIKRLEADLGAVSKEYGELKIVLGVKTDGRFEYARISKEAREAAAAAQQAFDAQLLALKMSGYSADMLPEAFDLEMGNAGQAMEKAELDFNATPTPANQTTLDNAKAILAAWMKLGDLWTARDESAAGVDQVGHLGFLRQQKVTLEKELADAQETYDGLLEDVLNG